MTPLPCSVYAEALKKWITGISGDLSIPVSDVANNSAEVAEGSLFCAIRGAKTDGHRFLADALAKGARAFVVAADSTWQAPDNLPVLRVNDSYRCWALCCETFYGKPADSMDVFAVTGTNGKTTIAYLIRKIFHAAFPEEPCGLLSTVEYDTGAGKTEEAARTTPDALTIQRLFARMKEHHCPRAVMEQSSHGLHQHRTGSLLFAGAVFTNLTGDHLDYHGTMENYFQAKRLLFMEMLRPGAPAVLNADDEYGRRLRAELRTKQQTVHSVTLHGEPEADIRVKNLKLSVDGAEFELDTPWGCRLIRSTLTGEYNVCNLALAAGLALSLGIPGELLQQVFAEPELAPPGRLEAISLPDGIRVFVDYAHTDDALFRVLSALRAVKPERLVTVFGCGGDRDKTKRPRMGEVAAKLSDEIVVTSDNPRTEDPLAIIEDIRRGIPAGCRCHIEPDRRAALELAVRLAGPGGFVLAAGKGHENYQEINGVKHPFDDREIIREIRDRSRK